MIVKQIFAGQKNVDRKIFRIPIFFLWKLKKHAKNITIVNSNKKLRPKVLGQYFSLFYALTCMTLPLDVINYHEQFQRHILGGMHPPRSA